MNPHTTTPEFAGHGAGIARRNIVKLFLCTISALTAGGTLEQLMAHEPTGRELSEFKHVRPGFTDSLTFRRNKTVVFKARLYCKENQHPHEVRPFDRRVQVKIDINGIWKGSVMTDRYGRVKVKIPLTYQGVLSPAGKEMHWTLRFEADSKNLGASDVGGYTLLP